MTVASEMNSRAAAPRFVSPWAISDEHLELAVAERVRRPGPGAGSSAACDRRREHGLAAGGGADRAEQLLARRVLEQVAGGAGLDGRHDVAVRVVGRQDEHARRDLPLGERRGSRPRR